MKEFFKKYSYIIVSKLFVTQIAIALFGTGLAFASAYAESTSLRICSSIGATVFYLFLIYAHMWEIGAKDGISAEARKTSRGLWRGFLMGVCANALNLLLALTITVTGLAHVADGLGQTATAAALLIEGMYFGILSTPISGIVLSGYAWVYFAITVPAIVVCGVAYILGSFNLRATNILIPKNKDVKNNGRPR